jgi:sortase B
MKQNNSKNKHGAGKSKNCLLIIVEISLFLLFIFSTAMTIMQVQQAKREQEAFSNLAAIVLGADQDSTVSKSDNTDVEQESPETQAPTAHPLYQNLYEMNNDFIGWLTISNTNIDYPVMFTPDEPEYYLRRAFDKTSSLSGTPFIGENGNIDSDCLIIYGHNMKNDTMFGTLDNYADKDFLTENRTFSFHTLLDDREYEVFAAVKTNILHSDETGFRYYNYSGDLSQRAYEELVDWLVANTVYDTGISPVYGEQILILSTCSYHTDNGRFIVAARRIM